MSHEKVNYNDVEAVAGGMHFLRDSLGCETVGLTVLECDPGWTGKEHDHADGDHEEVYFLVEGEATRQIENGDTESLFVLAGAP